MHVAHEQQQLAAQHEAGSDHDRHDEPGDGGGREQRA
jgi:hypothetical protein